MRNIKRAAVAVMMTAASLGVFAGSAGAVNDAWHYDYANSGSTSKLTIALDDCDGGGLTLSTGWRNRIDSTHSIDCYAWHYDGNGYTSYMQKIRSISNQFLIGSNHDKTNSLRYRSY